LVGRDGELEELTRLLRSPGVRLLTLTGTGGSGKTRLGVGVAQQLVDEFADGVFFVPLASVSTSEVMWTTLAEALEAPPESRSLPELFTYLGHRSALVVLDNLEQVAGADRVVAELLSHAPQVVVIATSRSPLQLPSEQEHPVPPLELPKETDVGAVARSGAVQLFVQQARRVKPSFMLSAENAAEVAAVCSRLDGLPLALELAAARSKLLSPRALLRRLDAALDIASSGSDGPRRQKTLRDTIAWSYDLLDPTLKIFFRRLGVFVGGADLDAITAIAVGDDSLVDADPFEMVAHLVNASLVSVDETSEGEPRFSMLETVRAYALDQLKASVEADEILGRHFHHYLSVALEWSPLLDTDRHVEARSVLEAELDNFREAHRSALSMAARADEGDGTSMSSRLCLALGSFWLGKGYFSELQEWLEDLIGLSGERDDPEVATCLALLATTLRMSGHRDQAHESAAASVAMWRRLGDISGLALPLNELAYSELDRGNPAIARSLFAEAVAAAREAGLKVDLLKVLGNSALLEHYEHNYQQSLELHAEVIALAEELGSPDFVLTARHNVACTLRGMGRLEDSKAQMRALIPQALDLGEPELLMVLAEDYAAGLADLGEHEAAVRLLGAADATRDRLATPRSGVQQVEVEEPMHKTRVLPRHRWNEIYVAGRNTDIAEALAQALEPETAPGPPTGAI
jgi:predicted ATPase